MSAPGASLPTQRGARASVVVDKCWTVPIVAALAEFLFTFIHTNGGIIYVLFIDELGATREEASWPKSITLAMTHLMGFVVGALEHRVPITTMLLFGGIICPLSIMASAFVPNMIWMSVTLGVFYGTSLGVLVISTSVYMAMYFDKYRSVATGISYLGGATAGVVGPSILTSLTSVYGTESALFIFGGIMLNILPFIWMLRNPQPTTWLTRWRSNRGNTEEKVNTTFPNGARSQPLPNSSGSSTALLRCDDEWRNKLSKLDSQNKSVHNKGKNKLNFLATSQLRASSPLQSNILSKDTNSESIFLHVFSLLQMPCFYVVLVSMVAVDFTMAAISSTIVDYTRDKIVDTERATLVSSILNLGILCGNLLIPFVSDTVVRSRCSVAALTCALLAVCFLVLPHVGSFASVSAATFVSGLQMGYIFTLKSVLFADYLGVCSVALSWGLMGVVAVPVLFCEPSIVGIFRDNGGSYDNLYRTCGAIDLVASLLLSAQAYSDAKKSKE